MLASMNRFIPEEIKRATGLDGIHQFLIGLQFPQRGHKILSGE
jgi:hypothetical protein